MRLIIPAAFLSGLLASPVAAAEVRVTIQIPRIMALEYYRPYTAIWIEKPDKTPVRTLNVWYNTRLRNDKGATWLNNVREWWRVTGRRMPVPADGISGPTRAPGVHQLIFAPMGSLPAGRYNLVVEAARERGGREAVRLPFQWPVEGARVVRTRGSRELREVTMSIRP